MNLFEVVNLNRAPKGLTGLDEIDVDGVDLVGVVFGLTFENKHFCEVVRAIDDGALGRRGATNIAG